MAFDLIPIAAVRAEGLTVQEASDARVSACIALAGQYIAKITGQLFRPLTFAVDAPLLVDGSGMSVLPLPAPVLELLSISGDGSPVALSDVAIFSRAFGGDGDERLYPRIQLRGDLGITPGLSMPVYMRGPAGRWERGAQNYALAGTFGFLDGRWRGAWDGATAYAAEDTVVRGLQTYYALANSTGVDPATDDGSHWQVGAAPALIRRAAIDLVLREYRLKTDPDYLQATQMARVKHEITDRHSYELTGIVATGLWTGDPAIDNVLTMYRRTYGGNTGGAW